MILQVAEQLAAEHVGFNVLALLVDNASDAELDVRDVVLAGLDKDGHNLVGDLLLVHEGHDD